MKSYQLKVLLFLTIVVACAQIDKVQSKSLEIMVYNVENLFDAQHDQGKNDFTFLPKKFPGKLNECKKINYHKYRKECESLDWNNEKVLLKLNQIKKVVDEAMKDRNKSQLPDIFALVEIENAKVVSELSKKLGYQDFVVSDSPDKRGVDLALLYNSKKMKLIKKEEIVLKDKYFEKKPTRNILVVQLKVDGKHDLFVMINHWPSLGNPTFTRLVAAKAVAEKIKSIKAKNKDANVLVVGDFNTIPENHPHPFHTHLFAENLLMDLHTKYKDDRKIPWHVKNKMPLGTYFYARGMSWNLLDRIFFDQNLADKKGMSLDHQTYEIFSRPFLTTSYLYQKDGEYLTGSQVNNIPKRYDHKKTVPKEQGFSDHFPILVKLNY